MSLCNENNIDISKVNALANSWSAMAIALKYKNRFNFEEFVALFQKTYPIVALYSTCSFVERGILKLLDRMRDFYENDHGAELLPFVCKLVVRLMILDAFMEKSPLEEEIKSCAIYYKHKSYIFDFTNIKESILEYIKAPFGDE